MGEGKRGEFLAKNLYQRENIHFVKGLFEVVGEINATDDGPGNHLSSRSLFKLDMRERADEWAQGSLWGRQKMVQLSSITGLARR